MKRYFALLTAVLALAACQVDQPDGSQYLAAPDLETSTGTVQFAPAGGSSTVRVLSAAGAVTATADRDWLTLSVEGQTVTLSASANDGLETRYAVVTVKADGSARNVQVFQFGVKAAEKWADHYDIPYGGTTLNLPFSPVEETIKVVVDGSDWISAALSEKELTVVVAQNPYKEERSGSISWIAGETVRSFTLAQEANPRGSNPGEDPGEEPAPGTVIFSEDFEDNTTLSEWMLVDADGDGNGWGYADETLTAHSGVGVLFSNSYINNVGAVTPDNWVFTPAISLGTDNYLSFWVTAQDMDYSGEHYGAYITETLPASAADLDNCTLLMEATYPGGNPAESETIGDHEYLRYVVAIPAEFASKTAYIAFRHFDCTDEFILNLDDVMVTVGRPEASSAASTSLSVPMPELHFLKARNLEAKRR